MKSRDDLVVKVTFLFPILKSLPSVFELYNISGHLHTMSSFDDQNIMFLGISYQINVPNQHHFHFISDIFLDS